VRAKIAGIALAACLGASAPSAADPTDYLHVVVPWHLHVDGGSNADIPMGSAHVYLDPDWDKLDAEFRRLQSEGTRLTAENASLKKTVEGWRPGWVIVVTAVVAGGVLGWLGHEYVAPHL
jgi:hypothetical protein